MCFFVLIQETDIITSWQISYHQIRSETRKFCVKLTAQHIKYSICFPILGGSLSLAGRYPTPGWVNPRPDPAWARSEVPPPGLGYPWPGLGYFPGRDLEPFTAVPPERTWNQWKYYGLSPGVDGHTPVNAGGKKALQQIYVTLCVNAAFVCGLQVGVPPSDWTLRRPTLT